MKILALVKLNSSVAMVLDEAPKLTYKKQGGSILGSDGTFLSTYYYDRPSPGFYAFAGRKFDLVMEDGEVIHCEGQYWHGVTDIHRKMVDGQIIHVTACDIDSLKRCYVFTGYEGIKHEIEKLMKSYKGIVYDYWDYEMLITQNRYRKPKNKLSAMLKRVKNSMRPRRAFTKELITD